MRRIPLPHGGWLLLGALALPILIRASSPLARKIGAGLRTAGDKLVDAASNFESPAPTTEHTKTTAKPKTRPRPAQRKPRTPRKPKDDQA